MLLHEAEEGTRVGNGENQGKKPLNSTQVNGNENGSGNQLQPKSQGSSPHNVEASQSQSSASSTNQTPTRIPFTVSATFPEIGYIDGESQNLPNLPPAPRFELIKSSWPDGSNRKNHSGGDGSPPKPFLKMDSTIADFTRYIVEELCCNTPSFVYSVLSLKSAAESLEEWQQRISGESMESVFVYDTLGHGGNGGIARHCMKTLVSLQPSSRFHDRCSVNLSKGRGGKRHVVYFSLSDANCRPDLPLAPYDNGFDTMMCHFKFKQILKSSSSSENSQFPGDGANLLLRISVNNECDPHFTMPAFMRKSKVEKAMREIKLTYAFAKDDPRGWSREDVDPSVIPSANDHPDFVGFVRGPIPYHPNQEIIRVPFTVDLVLPPEVQKQYGSDFPYFATVHSFWSGEPTAPTSKASIAEFTRHLVEDLYCRHPSFASAVVSLKADDESYDSWMMRQSNPISSAIFSYGTVGSGTTRRCITTTVTGNILNCANIFRDPFQSDTRVVIKFSLADVNFYPLVMLPSTSNAYSVLSCHHRACLLQHEAGKTNHLPWDGRLHLLLHVESICTSYKTIPPILGVKRKVRDEDDDSERMMELSYTKTYKHRNQSNQRHGQQIDMDQTPRTQSTLLNSTAATPNPKSKASLFNSPSKYARLESSAQKDFAANLLLSLGTGFE